MADYNATFAANNKCTRLNTGGTFGLCTKCESHHDNSLRRMEKDRRRRAKRTRTAGDCCNDGHDRRCHSRNALTSGHCGCR